MFQNMNISNHRLSAEIIKPPFPFQTPACWQHRMQEMEEDEMNDNTSEASDIFKESDKGSELVSQGGQAKRKKVLWCCP